MRKKEYINDKLFDMGERLKQNYAQPVTENTPQEVSIAPEKAPSSAASGRSDEFSRTLRDLEGRIANDHAAVEAELNELELRRRELERFKAILDECSGTLPNLCGDLKALDLLRVNYFAGSGRIKNAFKAPLSAAPAQNELPSAAAWKFALPVAAAIVVSAVLVSITLLILFL
jgi:hypothetical protein